MTDDRPTEDSDDTTAFENRLGDGTAAKLWELGKRGEVDRLFSSGDTREKGDDQGGHR